MLYISMKIFVVNVLYTTTVSNLYIVGNFGVFLTAEVRSYDSAITRLVMLLNGNIWSQVMSLQRIMYELSVLFRGNIINGLLIHWRRKAAKFTNFSGRVRSECTIYLIVECLACSVVLADIHYDGISLYTKTYIHNVESRSCRILWPYVTAICRTNHFENVKCMDWNQILSWHFHLVVVCAAAGLCATNLHSYQKLAFMVQM